MEKAVSAIAEKHQAAAGPPPAQFSEKAAGRSDGTPRHSMEGESSTPRKSTSSNEYDSSDGLDEKAAMSGLLRTIQRPLSSIGRIFSEEPSSSQSGPVKTPLPGNTPRMSPAPRPSSEIQRTQPRSRSQDASIRKRMTAEDAAARQASAEAAEAHRIARSEHANVVDTLAGMFPDLDREIISDVVTQKDGRSVNLYSSDSSRLTCFIRVGLAVDACLALSS